MAYDESIAKLKMAECPLCVDMTYVNEAGEEHILFDICEVHLKVTKYGVGDDGRNRQRGEPAT